MTEKTEFENEDDTQIESTEVKDFSSAVLHSADWTVETLIAQLTRKNIDMSPRFQRRDAWSTNRKSAFIESLVLGLPVPQIVLAEKQNQRGKYIVLDGKQRLLSLMQFTGNATESENNSFRLRGLEARSDLARKNYQQLQEPSHENDLNAFHNYTIRTVVIRNWPNYDFLHLVFLRLNTGSVKLSPQELRQAMFPGEFSNEVDDRAGESEPLRKLLGRDAPDPRMRDVELLVRYLGFKTFLPIYSGRMKEFLDLTCERLNQTWESESEDIISAIQSFNTVTDALIKIFGVEGVARKKGSKSFNRAIFDALAFYAANPTIRSAMLANTEKVKSAYDGIIANEEFLNAVDSDTAGVPNTYARLHLWGEALSSAVDLNLNLPTLRPAKLPNEKSGIDFEGFGV